MRIRSGALFCVFLFSMCTASLAYGSRDTTRAFPWKLHLQSRYSFPQGRVLAVWGASVGYTWGPYEREITLGYHWLGRRGAGQLGVIEKQNAQDQFHPIYSGVEAGFGTVGYWHILHNSKRWKMGIPLEAGLGIAQTESYSLLTDKPLLLARPRATWIVPALAGGYIEYKATRWVGVGIQSGYRYNLYRASGVDQLNGMYYRLRVLVYPTAFKEGFNFVFKGTRLPSPFFKKEIARP